MVRCLLHAALCTAGFALSFPFLNAQTPTESAPTSPSDAFRTSQRCIVCHNNFKTQSGQDTSIGSAWRASVMAHSARDPYWLASVRRETIDHAGASGAIQTECASCHMPLQRHIDEAEGKQTEVFSHLPYKPEDHADTAADGVSCAVCHQVEAEGLGTQATFNGNYKTAPLTAHPRAVYGPFSEDAETMTKVHVPTSGYTATEGKQIRDAGLCGSCHTLYTTSIGPDGKAISKLPEQMVYLEWEHSDYKGKQTCQECHMPAADGPVKVAALYAEPREGVRRHEIAGANFMLSSILSAHRDELGVAAPSADLDATAKSQRAFLQSHAATLAIGEVSHAGGKVSFPVVVTNLTGHKLPTSFPSRRAWLHIVVTAADGKVVFESGKLNADGSIVGNDNDQDPTKYEPHFQRITSADDVEIFESILGEPGEHVTTGLLAATHYIKDNRILPTGFDKKTASEDIAVRGTAADDPGFTAGSNTTVYEFSAGKKSGALKITAELLYQPIGFRWAQNLAPYKSGETEHFVSSFNQAAANSSEVLAHAEADSK